LLHAELTCAETLYYAAQLRLPQDFTAQERTERIEHAIALMGIGHCKDVIVGDTRKKGISGGERKRLCIAIELLSKPLLIFLDEPTSGLDSSTALTVTQALKNLAETGQCTVVCTIHQPQQKIFNLFDNLILLKKGKIVYQGGCQKCLGFLESIGMPCPAGENPADFLLDVISPAASEGDRVDEAVKEHEKHAPPVDLSMGAGKSFFDQQTRATWIHQFYVISRRSALQYLRRQDIILMNFVSTAAIACFIGGGIWYQMGLSQQAASSTLVPSLFFACVTQGIFGSMQVVNTFPSERAIMLRERSAGAYFVSSYYCAKSVIDMLSQIWPPVLFSCIAYFMVGYTTDANKFFIYMAFMMLDSLAATSLATAGTSLSFLSTYSYRCDNICLYPYIVSCWCVSVERSTVMLSFLFEMCRLYGGFFTSPEQLKSHQGWAFADALSYIKYAFMGVALNELTGLQFECPPTGTCSIPTGETIIEQKGYDQYTVGLCAGVLVLYIFAARFIGYIALRFIKV
jgi:ABC-type multidrug transport system ATPase subunit